MKKWLCSALLAAGIASLSLTVYGESGAETVTAEAAGSGIQAVDMASPLHYEFAEAGSFQQDQMPYFMRSAILVPEGDTYSMVSVNGEKIVGPIANAEYLGSGLYSVTEPLEEDNVNKTGLVTLEGEVIIPCEAASIALPANRNADGVRFLEVIYTTEKTDNEDECIIYFTESMFSLSVGEDDVMYKGYTGIFDLQNKRFVEGVQLDKANRNGFYDFGNSFAIEHGGTVNLYAENGAQIWESEGLVMGDTYSALSVSTDGKYYIVDGTGTDVYAADNSIDACCKALDLFKVYDGEQDAPYHIIDMQGNQVLPDAYGIVYDGTGSCYRVTKSADDDASVVVGTDGAVLAENVDYVVAGTGSYTYIKFADKDAVAVNSPAGYFDELEEDSSSNLFFRKGGKPVVLNTGEALELSDGAEASAIAPGLLKVEESTSAGTSYSLYDLFTGEQLLEPKYADIEMAGEYVCACTTDSSGAKNWEVYRTGLVPAA